MAEYLPSCEATRLIILKPLFTEIETNNCFSIYTRSDLNNVSERKPPKVDLIDCSIHAWKNAFVVVKSTCAKVRSL